MKRLDASLATCEAKATQAREAADARAAASHDALVAPVQQALDACEQRADLSRATCDDDCSSSATRCRKANGDRPNAREACDGAENGCANRCAESAQRACVTARAQFDKALNSGWVTAPQSDLCPSLRREADALGSECSKGLKAAAVPLEKANADVARLERAAQGDAGARRVVTDATGCGALGRAFFPSANVTLGGIPVNVDSFCMDRTEVTTSAYAACVASGKCTRSIYKGRCNAGVSGREDHPINCVDLNEAAAYCAAQGQRLPTAEEWEYAATGGDGRTYPWGNDEPKNQLCWDGEGNDLGKGNRRSTCAVGSYPRGDSPSGLVDLSGNVWEWTSPLHAFSNRIDRGGGWRDAVPSDVRSAPVAGTTPSPSTTTSASAAPARLCLEHATRFRSPRRARRQLALRRPVRRPLRLPHAAIYGVSAHDACQPRRGASSVRGSWWESRRWASALMVWREGE